MPKGKEKGGRGAIRNGTSSRKYLAGKKNVISNLEVTVGKYRFFCIMM